VHSNLVRTSFETFAAVVGGCDSVSVDGFDRTLGEQGEDALRLARNQHLLLREEASLGKVCDPVAGSHAIERLTNELCSAAWKILQEIEGAGGAAAMIASGALQQRIEKSGAELMRRADRRSAKIVGVNCYADAGEALPHHQLGDRSGVLERIAREEPIAKARRNEEEIGTLLGELRSRSAEERGYWMEVCVPAVREGATVSELLDAIFVPGSGRGASCHALRACVSADHFEHLRDRVLRDEVKRGRRHGALLIRMGDEAMRRARAEFVSSFLACAGIACEEMSPMATMDVAVTAIIEKSPRLVVFCSSDAEYAAFVPQVIEAARTLGKQAIFYIAGMPEADRAMLEAAGVAGFFHLRMNAAEELGRLLDALEIR
jgi:methylmalonyl-CoA mutase